LEVLGAKLSKFREICVGVCFDDGLELVEAFV
jgi:hypothetical protein